MGINGESLLGRTIEGYRLGRVLGTGSTSTVFVGQPLEQSQRSVAIKVLTLEDAEASTDHAAFRRRFLREARAARKLKHEHILSVLSYGEQDGLTYMIMPLIGHGTLAAWLAAQSGPVALDQAADFLRQTADALDYAHKQGVIHRDIKPSNLLMDEQGVIYLTDFGIARLFDSGGDALTKVYTVDHGQLTQTGEVLGTPFYMAPEQIKGEPISPATDVYALGIVLYLLVTGQVPFQGETPLAVALQHLQDEPCQPRLLRSDLPQAAEAAILRALAKQPEERFASAGELAVAFTQGIATADPTTATARSAMHVASGPPAEDGASSYRHLVGSALGDYQLEELLEVGELGPVFAARTAPTSPRYRLRVLPLPDAPAETRSTYLGQFQRSAHEVSELEHPAVLPLLDYGCYHGMPYLVSPLPAGQPLSIRLGQSGQLDLAQADRYLAQISAALDAAHEQGILHGSLSAENIFLSKKGEVTVADFGVRMMLDQSEQATTQPALYYDREAAAPEQLLGRPAEPASDVYALGCVLYYLLTGRPVFTGNTRDDIAQQHLHAAPPSLRRYRAGLPSALENILARALMKEPGQRYAHAGELSDAYHQVVTQGSGSAIAPAPRAGSSAPDGATMAGARAPTLIPSSGKPKRGQVPGSGTSGSDRIAASSPSTPVLPRRDLLLDKSATQVARMGDGDGAQDGDEPVAAASLMASPAATGTRTSTARAARAASVNAAGGGGSRGARLATMARQPRNQLYAVGALIVLAALIFGLLRFLTPTTSGTLTFSDGSGGPAGVTDTASVSAKNLSDPPTGQTYYAWLLNTTNESSRLLGPMVKHGDTYTVSFSESGGNGHGATNLLGQGFNKAEITLESSAGAPVRWPAGQVALQANIPPGAFDHIGHLLVMFPETPTKHGFLVGLQDQAQQLDAQAQALQVAVKNGNSATYTCYAQSIIDIIEGTSGPSYAPLPFGCAALGITTVGDGYGILGKEGYTAGASDHAHLAANASDATDAVKTHAANVETAAQNIDGWVSDADHSAWWLLHHPDDTSSVGDLVTACDSAYHGHATGDQPVKPIVGEAGAQTAYQEGQLMATLALTTPAK